MKPTPTACAPSQPPGGICQHVWKIYWINGESLPIVGTSPGVYTCWNTVGLYANQTGYLPARF